MTAHFTLAKEDHAGEFRSKLVAGNNETVAVSEGYSNTDDASRWADDMLRWVVEASEPKVRAALDECLSATLSSGSQRVLLVDTMIAALTA